MNIFEERRVQLADLSYDDAWNAIYRGSMPKLCEHLEFDCQMFHGVYLRTSSERDVRELSETGDAVKFTRFMIAVAVTTVQLFSKSCKDDR